MMAAFEDLSRGLAHPAALLDAGMVYLALNRPYARMLQLPASALVGKEYSRVHGDKQVALAMLEVIVAGAPKVIDLPAPVPGADGVVYGARRLTPLRNAAAQALGMVLEYCPAAADAVG
jgi:PAS domain-containing protein